MNENMQDKTVWLTTTYEYVDSHPYDDDIKMVWMDVRQCGTSQVNPPSCECGTYLRKGIGLI